MRAKKLSEIRVYRKAQDAACAVSALLRRPVFSKNLDLKDQLKRSSGRVGPLIAEGYGQLSDRHLAVYLGRARGSVQETISLELAYRDSFINNSEYLGHIDTYDHIGKMLTRWINHLQRSNWKDPH